VCGRFSFAVKAHIIEERFDAEVDAGLFTPRYNCAPSQNLSVISNSDPDKVDLYRWGLIPVWAKDPMIGNKLINAKAETLSEKPSFRSPFQKRRCLVLADGFYEWKRDDNKSPYRILLADESPFAMAGIWDSWYNNNGEEVRSFSIITTVANDLVADIHHRMPVILTRENEKRWLDNLPREELQGMLVPYASDNMKAYKISKMVNSPKNDHPDIWNSI
jgi:putative SOS response-associated peptidase YedK